VARTRPGSDRPLRFTEAEEPAAPDEGPDEDDDQDAGTLPTSLDDLTTEADPQQFDRTFTAGGAPLRIQGAFDPVAGNKQVIPRVAYVLNYNLIYNESRDRWEPQKKSDVGGVTGAARAFQASGTNQSVPAAATTTVDLTASSFDSLDAVDLSNDEIVAPADGTFLLAGLLTYLISGSGAEYDLNLEVNGSTVAAARQAAPDTSQQIADLSAEATDVRTLSEGDAVSMTTDQDSGGTVSLNSGPDSVFLAVVQLT
jgi:hypothetical protein